MAEGTHPAVSGGSEIGRQLSAMTTITSVVRHAPESLATGLEFPSFDVLAGDKEGPVDVDQIDRNKR
jgi:hypothetical protein